MKTIVMNPEERQIWRAAYASAFATDFEIGITNQLELSQTEAVNQTVKMTRAEYAITVADTAVVRYKQAISENHEIGQLIYWPEEWE